MSLNTLQNLEYCASVVDPLRGLLLYSHIAPAVISIIIGLFILFKSRERLVAWIFFLLATTFSAWSFLDLNIWTRFDQESVVMFSWSLVNLFDLLFYILSLYFIYVFLDKKDVSFNLKLIWLAILTPIFYALFTENDLVGFYLPECFAIEHVWYTNYIFCAELFISAWIVALCLTRLYRWRHDLILRKEIILLLLGLIIFLLSFFGAGFISDMTGSYTYEQLGLFGMVVFLAILSYLVVELKLFNIKLIATQALVVSLVLLIGSQFLFIQTDINRILNGIALIFSVFFGYFLVKSVKREIQQREHIEKLAGELQETNERQEVLFHFIGHEVKGFLAKDAGAFASLSEGDYGALPEAMKSFVEQALAGARQGADSVGNILKASNLKKGSVTYTKEPFDLKALTTEAVEKARAMAEKKGLALSFIADDSSYQMTGDKVQISDHVLRNLIENAINYTPSGSIIVSLKKDPSTGLGAGKFVFAVKDSGVGITEEDKKRLFTEGGHGKDSQKVNAHSTGYGLYIAKSVALAHGGTIRAESEGEGKGSTFIVELPT